MPFATLPVSNRIFVGWMPKGRTNRDKLRAFPGSRTEDYVFPACEGAGIERAHADAERIDASRPIRSRRTAWRGALKRAGLQIRFHDLRHTCITKLAEGQGSEQTIIAISGHPSRRMVEHYRTFAWKRIGQH
jgi:integrase